MEQIKGLAKERFVYVDEAGVDDTLNYPYGYCPKGERFESLKLAYPTKRVSMISGGGVVQLLHRWYLKDTVIVSWFANGLRNFSCLHS